MSMSHASTAAATTSSKRTAQQPPGSLCQLLHRAGQIADDHWSAIVAQEHDGLTPRQYLVLAHVREMEPCTQTALVEATGIDRSTLAGIVHRLVGRKLLQRRRMKTDGRAYDVKLSLPGISVLNAAESEVIRTEQVTLHGLSSTERNQLAQLLAKVSRNVRKRTA